MADLCWVTSFCNPYRKHLFETLSGVLQERGQTLFVYFFDVGKFAGRNGDDPRTYSFNWKTLRGWHPSGSGFHVRLSCGLEKQFRAYRWLLIGGYYCPTLVSFAFLPTAVGQTRILWTESHGLAVTKAAPLSKKLKRLIMNRYDTFVIPGRWAREYVECLRTARRPARFLSLPNIVDETVWGDGVKQARAMREVVRRSLGLGRSDRFVLCCARLVAIKGLQEVVSTLGKEDLRNALLGIAGAGPLRKTLEQELVARKTRDRIVLFGQRDQQSLVNLMAAADAFLLASKEDRSPVAVIEACWAGLPLVLSTRVGNHPECLIEGKNGFLFDVTDPGSLRRAWHKFLSLGDTELREMGRVSHNLALQVYSSEATTARFVEDLQKV